MPYNHCLVMLEVKIKEIKQVCTLKKITDYNSQLQLMDIIFTDTPGGVPVT